MSFKFRICNNDTSSWLRETFSATPLKVPEARVQPLNVLALKDGVSNFRGVLKYLLKDTEAFNPPIATDQIASVALDRTKKVDVELGVSILDGFFKALKMDTIALGLALKGVKKLSLSFTNVQRRWVDLGLLGQAVKTNQLDFENPSFSIFKSNDPATLLLVTDAIVSRSFGINNEEGRDDAFDLNMPLLEKYISDAKLGVKVNKNSQSSISFEGQEPLTFAFSCVRVEFNNSTGELALMETVNPKRNVSSDPETIVERAVLDDDEYQPLMLTLN